MKKSKSNTITKEIQKYRTKRQQNKVAEHKFSHSLQKNMHLRNVY